MIYKLLKSIQLFFKTAKIMICLALAWDINRIHHYEQMQDEVDKEMEKLFKRKK